MNSHSISLAIGLAKGAKDSASQIEDLLSVAQRAGRTDKEMGEQLAVLLDRFSTFSDSLVATLLEAATEPEPATTKKLAAFELEDDDTNLSATDFPQDQKKPDLSTTK